jgi:hypothetical protein
MGCTPDSFFVKLTHPKGQGAQAGQVTVGVEVGHGWFKRGNGKNNEWLMQHTNNNYFSL